MSAALIIRRLRLHALTPHDHPAPAGLGARLAEAARCNLADALKKPLQHRPQGAVTRIRRLSLDITLEASADDAAFAALLAEAIAAALQAAEAPDAADDNVVSFASPASHLAALLEALAAGRAAECWWLRDAEGLRFLPPPAALRTALLAEPGLGQAALLTLSPARLAAILAVMGPREAGRVLSALAAAAPAASPVHCARAIAALNAPPGSSALFLYIRAAATSDAGGLALAAAARLHAALTALLADAGHSAAPAAHNPQTPSATAHAANKLAALAAASALPDAACAIITHALGLPATALAGLATQGSLRPIRHRRAAGAASPEPRFSRFAGLLLLVPSLDLAGLAKAAPDTAPLAGFAALGLCAGRANFAAWLRDPTWRLLFGLDERATGAELAAQLGAIAPAQWLPLAPLAQPPASCREAKFLLPPANLLAPQTPAAARLAARSLAALANAAGQRFARRLTGLRAASAPFLWENLLGAGGVLEYCEECWHAQLNRPALDVLLSLSRLAEGSVTLPQGRVQLHRVAP